MTKMHCIHSWNSQGIKYTIFQKGVNEENRSIFLELQRSKVKEKAVFHILWRVRDNARYAGAQDRKEKQMAGEDDYRTCVS